MGLSLGSVRVSGRPFLGIGGCAGSVRRAERVVPLVRSGFIAAEASAGTRPLLMGSQGFGPISQVEPEISQGRSVVRKGI